MINRQGRSTHRRGQQVADACLHRKCIAKRGATASSFKTAKLNKQRIKDRRGQQTAQHDGLWIKHAAKDLYRRCQMRRGLFDPAFDRFIIG